MGQNITCLITDKNIEIDKNIVHFKIKGLTFIPFDINSDFVSIFIEDAKDFTLIKDYINYLKSENAFIEPDEEEHTDEHIVKMIDKLGLDNFILEHYYEFGDIPVETYFMYVKNGEIIADSLAFDEEKFSRNNLSHKKKYYEDLNIDFSWIAMEDVFHSYRQAKENYYK